MPGTSLKNYIVNYDLVVNAAATEGFAKVEQMANQMQTPLQKISEHFKQIQQSANALKNSKAFEIRPSIDLKGFDAQSKTLITKAEKVASQVNAILNGAFTMKPTKSGTGGNKGNGTSTPSKKTEKRTFTTDQLKQEANEVKKQLRNLYGPRGVMSERAKGYRSLIESIQGDAAKLSSFKALRTKLAAINADIKTASKNNGKIVKTITDGVAQSVTKGVKEGSKKTSKTPKVISAFDNVLHGLVAGKSVEVPISLVANAKTVESVNQALAKVKGQVKPITIPITVATNIEAAKSVRETVNNLQNILTGKGGATSSVTPSSTGNKSVGKGKDTTTPATTPVVKTEEQKALEKDLRKLKSEQNKYNHWKKRHDEWKKRVAQINETATTPNPKLPVEPVLAEGIRTSRQIAAQRRKINQRLETIKNATTPATTPVIDKKSGRGKAKTPITSTGGAILPITESVQQLQSLAGEKVIALKLQMAPITAVQTQLKEQIAALQAQANKKAIALNTTLASARKKSGKGKGTTTGKTTNTIPFEGVVEKVVVSKSAKISGGPVKVEGIVENIRPGRGMKPIELKANVISPGLNSQVNTLRELSNIWKALPKTGRRTYTVNLKMPGIENLGKLKELQGLVSAMPPSQRRSYSNNLSRRGNNGTAMAGIYSEPNTSSRYIGRPKGTMNTFAYQLMGNTSLGARTPVFLDMMKGMGMMTGVGAAMNTLTNTFTNAAEYQNTMVTARSILEANYKGSNFNADFSNMERIVRDVAKKTKFTAPQSADAARFMAMAGLNIPMINASIRPVADVAVIGDNDLGEVADKITNIQTAFGIQPNKMRALADALTKTFTSSNTDMMMLAESMEYAAPMAHLAGAQVEDALAMIGIMGNAGIQGSMAGTTLRMMYQNVINPNKKQKQLWDSLGISLKDANGNPRQLIEILGDLRQKVRVSKEDKDEEGRFKDEGTPIATAVSRLFRVTASAGAGTLLENLDKVIALAEANRNAAGLSQRISEVKQNNVKGMWAKSTSAFTDAVVTEFEKQENPIKGYLKNITNYFNSGEFKDLLHDVFDLVTSMLDMLGQFVKVWRKIYNIFGPIIKYTLMTQFWLTQIGYMLAPLRSIWLTFSRGIGALNNNLLSSSSIVGGTGVVAASGAPLLSFGNNSANYNTAAINAARATALQKDIALANSRKYFAAATLANAATTPGIEKAIAKKQMQWFVASNLIGNAASLRSSDNRPGRWNLAYTNPQAVSELPNRFKIMAAREREVATLQQRLIRRSSNITNAEAMVVANTASSVNAHRALNEKIADVRHSYRRVDPAVLNRAVQMGKISNWQAIRMSASSGFRTAATWGITGIGLAGAMSGLTSVVGTLSKVLGFILNPLTLFASAVIGLGVAAYSITSKIRETNEKLQNEAQLAGEETRKMISQYQAINNLSSVFHDIQSVSINAGSVNVVNQQNEIPVSANEAYKSFYDILTDENNFKRSLLKNPNEYDKYFLNRSIQDGTVAAWYNNFISPMVGLVPGLSSTYEEAKRLSKRGGGYSNAQIAIQSLQAIHGQYGYAAALEAQKEINTLYSELFSFDDKKRKELTPEYLLRIKEIADRYNPALHPEAKTVTGDNLREALKWIPSQDAIYYQTANLAIRKYLNESGLVQAINAYTTMKDATPKINDTQKWSNIIWSFAQSMPVHAVTSKGEQIDVNLPFNQNHTLNKEALRSTLMSKDVILADYTQSYIKMLEDVYQQMLNIPNLKDHLNKIKFTKEDFVKQSMNYGGNVGVWEDTSTGVLNKYYQSYPTPMINANQSILSNPIWAGYSQAGYAYKSATNNQQSQRPVLVSIGNITLNTKVTEEVDPKDISPIITKGISDFHWQLWGEHGGYQWQH